MSEQIEIEFKNMLSASEFQRLLVFFDVQKDAFFVQKNIYFDTIDGKLQKQHAALRIRLGETYREATLKTPATEGLLETTETLPFQPLEDDTDLTVFPQIPLMSKKLNTLGITPEDLVVIASLKTKRCEIHLSQDALLVLDESWYHGQHDYELEMEVTSYEKGKQFFENFLTKHQLPVRPAKNKIVRAIQAQQ